MCERDSNTTISSPKATGSRVVEATNKRHWHKVLLTCLEGIGELSAATHRRLTLQLISRMSTTSIEDWKALANIYSESLC